MKQFKLLAGAVLCSLAVACGSVPNSSDLAAQSAVNSASDLDFSSPDVDVMVGLADDADGLFAQAGGDGEVGGRWYAVASPINNTLVTANTKIKVEFRADMKKATCQNSFKVKAVFKKNGSTITQTISGRFKWSAGDTKLEFTPNNMPGKANVTWKITGCKTELLETVTPLQLQKYRTK